MHLHLQIESRKGQEFNQIKIPNKPNENKTKQNFEKKMLRRES
jgi:hypothetical protein